MKERWEGRTKRKLLRRRDATGREEWKDREVDREEQKERKEGEKK